MPAFDELEPILDDASASAAAEKETAISVVSMSGNEHVSERFLRLLAL